MSSLKLYLASRDVMFISSHSNPGDIENDAHCFLKEEISNCREHYEVKQICDIKDVPEKWQEAFVWGCNEDLTPIDFLVRGDIKNDPDYKTYLRLKEKFEKK